MSNIIIEDEIPEECLCPITQQAYRDPVMDSLGHTYERSAILSWLGANGTCPLTRRPMKASDLIPNTIMLTKVRLWQRSHGQELPPFENAYNRNVVAYFSFDDDPTEEESVSGNGDEEDAHLEQMIAHFIYVQQQHQHPEQASSGTHRHHHHDHDGHHTQTHSSESRNHRSRQEDSESEGNQRWRGFRLFGGNSSPSR
jgi:hypothetical protein